MRQLFFSIIVVMLTVACANVRSPLPREKASEGLDSAFTSYLSAVRERSLDLHSIMVIQHGKVLEEAQLAPDTAHVMFSVSKTFTSAAVGFAIDDGLLSLDDRIVDIFDDHLPEQYSPQLEKITLRHLLTMTCGHGNDPTYNYMEKDGDWIKAFMEWPIEFEPGSCFCYNSLGTFILSAAVQKVTGKRLVDYLETRLWEPLGIEKPFWQVNSQGINTGGWGLFLRTEDMARMGICLLNEGRFGGRQVIPKWWVKEMETKHVDSSPAHFNRQQADAIIDNLDHPQHDFFSKAAKDWLWGYGYQMWLCPDGAVRADGSKGQFIIVIPNKDAVIVTTAHISNMALELKQIWDYIVPAL